MLIARRPMPVVRVSAPFDHPDWMFELNDDGFCAHPSDLLTGQKQSHVSIVR